MTEIKRRLTRARDGAWIAGVCAGLAHYLGLRPAVVRAAYVLVSVVPLFPGILIYLLLWLVIPRESDVALQS